MAKYEITKNVEAVKLNKRTGIPLTEPAVTIPYGAILDNVEEVGDFFKFNYLTDRYQFKKDVVKGAILPLGNAPAMEGSPVAEAAGEPAVLKPLLAFESLRVKGSAALSRAKVPGGWLVMSGGGITFVPDAGHGWDGGSL